jgi:dATP/dGTP diphosphohydrolase
MSDTVLPTFTVKDSGARQNLGGGVRDTEEGKTDYTLILDGPMYTRWAEHLTKGAKKYAARNWMGFKSDPVKATERAKRSLMRHLVQYMNGETDEDHAAAIFFNLNVIEYLKEFIVTPDEKLHTFDIMETRGGYMDDAVVNRVRVKAGEVVSVTPQQYVRARPDLD